MKHQTSFFVITQNVIFGTLANIWLAISSIYYYLPRILRSLGS